MIILDVPQLSEQWFLARTGVPSASKFSQIVTTTGAYSKQAEKYILQLAGEKVIGKKEETYQNAAMLRGVELEPEARGLYEMMKGVDVQEVGLCYRDDEKLYSCSPDGLVGDGGCLEIKCPQLHTHVDYLLKGKLPSTYFQQVQGQLYITGRAWCDFFSYYPGIKPFLIRVEPDIEFHKKLAEALDKFCTELNEIYEKIK